MSPIWQLGHVGKGADVFAKQSLPCLLYLLNRQEGRRLHSQAHQKLCAFKALETCEPALFITVQANREQRSNSSLQVNCYKPWELDRREHQSRLCGGVANSPQPWKRKRKRNFWHVMTDKSYVCVSRLWATKLAVVNSCRDATPRH